MTINLTREELKLITDAMRQSTFKYDNEKQAYELISRLQRLLASERQT